MQRASFGTGSHGRRTFTTRGNSSWEVWRLRDLPVLKGVCDYFVGINLDENVVIWLVLVYLLLDSLWPSDTIFWHKSASGLDQVMDCCLTAPIHYFNQCWLVTSNWGQFYRKWSRYLSLIWVWKLLILKIADAWPSNSIIDHSTNLINQVNVMKWVPTVLPVIDVNP